MTPILGKLLREARRRRKRFQLARTPQSPSDAGVLNRQVTESDIATALRSAELAEEWADVDTTLSSIEITDRAESVNPGDRRTIYYLVRYFRPHRVLEIGTHLGASTIHIAAALRRIDEEDAEGERHVTTVDIQDVNDEATGWWRRHGSAFSPAETARRLGLASRISFVTRPSLEYLALCDEQFDLIFLDGDHTARTVYREVSAALRLLRSGGVILLHDYFPEAKPLWPGENVIEGPWLAIERLRTEGAALCAIPLGDVPWPTKFGSQRTSLAVLVGSKA